MWWGMVDGKSWAKEHAGEVVEYRPLDPDVPRQRVRVVGGFFSLVLVELVGPAPSEVTSMTQPVTHYPLDSYLRVTTGDRVLALPPTVLVPYDFDSAHYPHVCPKCSAPAYVGVVPAAVDCSRRCSP